METASGGHKLQGLPVQFHQHQHRARIGLLDDCGQGAAGGQGEYSGKCRQLWKFWFKGSS